MKTPFASRLQTVFVFLMLLSIFLIGQQWIQGVYKAGMVLLFVSVLLNMAISNVPSHHGLARTLKLSGIFFAIVVVVFAVAIFAVPYLYALGQLDVNQR
jgi:hypothetical protein